MHREVFGQGEGGSLRVPLAPTQTPRRHREATQLAPGSLPQTPSSGRDPPPEDALAEALTARQTPALSHLRCRSPGAREPSQNGG